MTPGHNGVDRAVITFDGGGMFEHALSSDSWQETGARAEPEADEQLAQLAQNVTAYPVTEIEPPTFAGPAGPAAEAIPQEEPPVAPVVTQCRPEIPAGHFAVLSPGCPTRYLEQFQLLRTQLLLLRAHCGPDQQLQCVSITSAGPGEGKTFTARNLAATLALASTTRVLLIETGARQGALTDPNGGLEAALVQPDSWMHASAVVAKVGLTVLSGGDASTDFEPLPALLNTLRPHFDWIVIDAPALQSAAAAEWITACADVTLLVVRRGGLFDRVAEAVGRIPAERLAGVVMNDYQVRTRRRWIPKIRIRIKRKAA